MLSLEMERGREGGTNKGYASKLIYFTISNHTLLIKTKCRVGARTPPRDGKGGEREHKMQKSKIKS